MINKQMVKGRFKALTIYAITQDGQGMRIILTEAEKVVTAQVNAFAGWNFEKRGVLLAYKGSGC